MGSGIYNQALASFMLLYIQYICYLMIDGLNIAETLDLFSNIFTLFYLHDIRKRVTTAQ